MMNLLELLDRAFTHAACPGRWEDMAGDGPVRRCRHCDHDVHDLDGLAPADLRRLLDAQPERLCVRQMRLEVFLELTYLVWYVRGEAGRAMFEGLGPPSRSARNRDGRKRAEDGPGSV